MNRWFVTLALVVAALTIAIGTMVFFQDTASPNFQEYKRHSEQVRMGDYEISQETAETFASNNCKLYEQGSNVSLKYQSDDHFKSTASVVAAYCSETAFYAFLAAEYGMHPEMSDVIMFVEKRIKL